MPNTPAPHPDNPYGWSVAHYVPRVVIRRGEPVVMKVAAWKGASRLWEFVSRATPDVDGLVQGFQLSTAPPNSRRPILDEREADLYFFHEHPRPLLSVGERVTVEFWRGAGVISTETIVPADCYLDGFGLQVAPLDAERRREVERIGKEAEAAASPEVIVVDPAPPETAEPLGFGGGETGGGGAGGSWEPVETVGSDGDEGQ